MTKGKYLKLVIAGNHEQYVDYIRKNKETEFTAKYVNREDQIRGYRSSDLSIKIVRWGEYWKNPLDQSSYLRALETDAAITKLKEEK